MKRSNRVVWFGAIAASVIILISLIAAPSNSKINIGSTYNRAPDGYGAWYAFMQQRHSIQRWQKPFKELETQTRPVTLLQVNSYLETPIISPQERKWLEKGNNLVILGVRPDVTAAKFSTMQKSPFGNVKIDTGRRRELETGEEVDLGDRFGAVVWKKQYGKGKAIFATTPYLAANAYQDNLSNFQYLADLVSNKGNILFVNEYIHGYKDPSVRKSEGEGDLFSYLAKTPLLPMLVQAIAFLGVLIWAQNRRFGKPETLHTPEINNSQAYIQALAGVLLKADKNDFVVEMVGKQEQLQLQKALGLGQVLMEHQTLIDAWVEKTGATAAELQAVLKVQSRQQPMSERDLISWLGKWQSLRRIKN
jgi:hypothetical protein